MMQSAGAGGQESVLGVIAPEPNHEPRETLPLSHTKRKQTANIGRFYLEYHSKRWLFV